MTVYEIVSIDRIGGELPADHDRIGSRVIPTHLAKGSSAVLASMDDCGFGMRTSTVEGLARYDDGSMTITTRNATYILRREV